MIPVFSTLNGLSSDGKHGKNLDKALDVFLLHSILSRLSVFLYKNLYLSSL